MKKIWQKLTQSRFLSHFLYFYQSSELEITSVAVGYYLLISLLPILMTLINILPYLRLDITDFLAFIDEFLPQRLYHYVSQIILNLFTRPSSGWLSVSILTTAWTFSRSLSALQKGFNKAYGLRQHRDFIISRIVSLFVSLILQLALIILLLLATFGKSALTLLQGFLPINDQLFNWLLSLIPPVTVGLLFFLLIFFYTLLPNVRIPRYRYVLPGACYVVLVLTGLSTFFANYLERYAAQLMGFRMVSYVVIVLLMLWFTFISRILIVGAVLNATYQSLKEDQFVLRRGTVADVLDKYRRK